jgi:FkbM family methyltransferase
MSRYFGTVYSFEPQVEIYRMLCANLLLNNCHNVIATNGALYDVEGQMRMAPPAVQEISVPRDGTQPAYDAIGNAAALMFELAPAPDEQSVPCRTIDGMGLTTLALLKVDAQGSDLHILQGARATIARCRPAIVAECERELTRAHHHTIDDYRAFFAQVDYDVKVLDDRSSGKQIDFLAIPR